MTTNTNKQIWLLIEKIDDTRVSKGPEGYNDDTGKIYNYDSNVRNYKNLKMFDVVILRKENKIVGFGKISNIKSKQTKKILKRCPKCETSDIRIRKTISPKWICRKCNSSFDIPNEIHKDITDYSAIIIGNKPFNKALHVNNVKSWSLKKNGIKSQNSIIELEFNKIVELKDIDPKSFEEIENLYFKQDNGLNSLKNTRRIENNLLKKKLTKTEKEILTKFRVQQGFFREQLIKYWGGCCSISGFDKTELLIASHIKPYSKCKKNEKYDVNNGLLLTPNYDKLFDKYLISFDNHGKILISNQLNVTDIKNLNIKKKASFKMKEEHKPYMKYHRNRFLEKQKNQDLE